MPRPRKKLSSDEVKEAADRAEGLAPSKKVGRPSSYQPGYAIQAQKLCELGATDAEIAEFFGVVYFTLVRWKSQFPEFNAALKTAHAAADTRVERSLYQRAIGYTYEAVKIFMPAGASEPVYAPYREVVPPDTTAQIFWLKNRKREEWRDAHKVEHSGTLTLEALVGASFGQSPQPKQIEASVIPPADNAGD